MKPARYLLLPLVLFAMTLGIARAQSAMGNEKFPVPYGPNNIGTEFFMSFPANWDYAASYKYIRLYITSGVSTTVRVYAGRTLVKTVQTEPYGIVTVDLTLLQAQVFTRNDFSPVPPDQVYKQRAVKVVADDPIVVYGMNRITYTSDGLLALPTTGIGREYVVASARDITGGYQKLPSQYMIIAPYNGTTVTIINSSETPNNKAGKVVTISMDSGDVYSAMSAEGTGGDLTGTFISASRPVVVTAGQNCTYLPTQQYPACDHLCEMMLPLSSWGNVYHSVPFSGRTKGDLYRIFAGDANAKIFINGAHIATLPQVGGDQGGGWLEYLPPDRKLLEFSSDKRIMIAQYNNSQTYDNATNTDPMYMVLTPVQQFQNDLVFCTPSTDYGDNYVNLVADSAAYYNIEIAKNGNGQFDKLALRYPTLVRPFTSKLNGKTYVGVNFRIDPGVYHMRGPGPFAGYLYGFNNFDSYGYPLSAATGDLSKPDSIAPLITRTQDCFGTVQATVLDLPHDDSVRSNLSTIRLERAQSFNYRLTVTPFVPGESPGTTYRLNVINPAIDARAVVNVSDMRGNVSFDTVTYASFKVAPDSTVLDFELMFTGTNKTMSMLVRNLSTRAVTITQTSLKLGTEGFTLLDPTGPFTLEPAGSGAASERNISVRFDATVAGRFADSIGLRDDCGFRYITRVQAEVGSPVIEVTDIPFGAWPITAPPLTRSFTIANISSEPGTLKVSGVAQNVNDNVTFTLPDGLPAFPMELAAGETSQAINVSFKPNAVQDYIDSIVFNHNAPPNPRNDPTAILTGRGIVGSLIATPFDWGRKRVDGNSHPATVRLTNIGSSDVTLRAPAIITGHTGDFSIVDHNDYSNRVLGPNGFVDVRVLFTPTATGQRQAMITWPHDPQQSEPVTSELLGFGTLPELTTQPYDFGTMDVSEPTDNTRQVEFRLPPVGTPDVMDSVTIIDFVITGDVNDFRFDKPTLPITLKRGNESVVFTGYFNASAPGPRTASVTAITRPEDNVNVTSVWTGVGTVKDPLIEGDPVAFGVLCATSNTLTANIRNTGLVMVTITDMQLQGLPASFVLDPSLQFPIDLDPGATLSVPITFTAAGSGVYSGGLVVTNNSSNAGSLIIPVSGITVDQDVDVDVALSAGGPLGRVELGKDFLAKVNMTEAIDPNIPITSYQVTLTYDKDQMAPNKDGIAVGAANPNATWAIGLETPGTLVLDVTSPTPLAATGTLIEVPFSVYFHASENRRVDASVTTGDAACLRFTTTPDSIEVVPICGLSVRLIEMNSTTYALNQNVPNPFNPVTKIKYSLGLDGRTQLQLRDAAGKLVQTLLDEVQLPGTYELTLDVTDLPSGMYYYTLTSGAWTATKTLMVTK